MTASLDGAVVVTGLGVVSGVGVGVPAFAAGLAAGVSAARPADAGPTPVTAPLPDVGEQVTDAGLTGRAGERLRAVLHRAPQATAAAVTAAAEAAAVARLCEPSGPDADRVGVVVAGSNLTNREVSRAALRQGSGRRVLPRHAVQLFDSDLAASVGEVLGVRGETWTAGAASASGTLAIALARRAIRCGDLDAVVVVGAPMLLTDADLEAFSGLGALFRGPLDDPAAAASSCRPFDRGAAGFVYGEAAAAVVLERADSAARRDAPARAVVGGVGICSSATRSPAPDSDAEGAAMRAALACAGIDPDEVDLVNAHATASAPGDRAEADAIVSVFGRPRGGRPGPRVNATKALTAHCMAAAGVVEAVATVVQLEGGFLHPNPNLTDPIEELSWVGAGAETWSGRCAVSNSFGFGGQHASVVLTTA